MNQNKNRTIRIIGLIIIKMTAIIFLGAGLLTLLLSNTSISESTLSVLVTAIIGVLGVAVGMSPKGLVPNKEKEGTNENK